MQGKIEEKALETERLKGDLAETHNQVNELNLLVERLLTPNSVISYRVVSSSAVSMYRIQLNMMDGAANLNRKSLTISYRRRKKDFLVARIYSHVLKI